MSSPRWQPVVVDAGRPVTPIERHAVLIGSVANGTNDPDFDGTLRQALTVLPGPDSVPGSRVARTRAADSEDDGPGTRSPATHASPRSVRTDRCQRAHRGERLGRWSHDGGRAQRLGLHTGDTIARDQVEVERKEDVLKAVGVIASSMRRSLGESGSRSSSTTCRLGSDDAVSRRAEGVHRGRREARGRERDRVDTILRARYRPGPQLRPGVYHALEHLRRLGETGRGRTTRDWRTNTARRSASASVSSSPTSTTTE